MKFILLVVKLVIKPWQPWHVKALVGREWYFSALAGV